MDCKKHKRRITSLTGMALLSAFALGQSNPPPIDPSKYELVEVVAVEGTASELYRKAERWFVDTFKDAQEVVHLKDTVTHTLVGKGYADFMVMAGKGITAAFLTKPFDYSMEVACKDGRYRVRVYDAHMKNQTAALPIALQDTCYQAFPSTSGGKNMRVIPVQVRDQYCVQAMGTIRPLIASLKAAMAKPKEDW
jgi:hypothetical protein